MRSGRAGPRAQPGKLPRAPRGATRRTVTSQRARTHPQARGQRRRYVVQRRTAIAAEFSSGIHRAQPVASRRAFRINTLHSPTGQILHFFLSCFAASSKQSPHPIPAGCKASPHPVSCRTNFFRSSAPVTRETKNPRKKLPEFCASGLVASREKIQFLVVRLQSGPAAPAADAIGDFAFHP
jgi:hypothetical protein